MSDEAKARGPDMSPEAIDRRLRDLGQLYELGRELATARYLGKVEDLNPPAGSRGNRKARSGRNRAR